MAAVTITPADLEPFAPGIDPDKAEAMITDALAMAELVAPCITTVEFTKAAAAKAILRGAILRWNDSGSGAVASRTALQFSESIDTRQVRKSMFWPSEIEQLQALCGDGEKSGAFAVDTVAQCTVVHADICTLNFGGEYCSCGAVLTGLFPMWEQ